MQTHINVQGHLSLNHRPTFLSISKLGSKLLPTHDIFSPTLANLLGTLAHHQEEMFSDPTLRKIHLPMSSPISQLEDSGKHQGEFTKKTQYVIKSGIHHWLESLNY